MAYDISVFVDIVMGSLVPLMFVMYREVHKVRREIMSLRVELYKELRQIESRLSRLEGRVNGLHAGRA